MEEEEQEEEEEEEEEDVNPYLSLVVLIHPY